MSSDLAFEPYGVTLFCEDIREEVNGSLTLVGVMPSAGLVVAALPAIIAKFAVLVTVIMPSVAKSKMIVELDMFAPGDPADKPSVSISHETDVVTGGALDDPDIPKHAKVVQRFVVSPLPIQREGFFKVRTRIDGKLIKAGVLRLMLAPSVNS